MDGQEQGGRLGRAPVKKWEGEEEGTEEQAGEGRMEDTSNGEEAKRGEEKQDPHFSWVSTFPAKRIVLGNRSTSKGIRVCSPSVQGSASRDKNTGSKIQIEEIKRMLAIQISQRKEKKYIY